MTTNGTVSCYKLRIGKIYLQIEEHCEFTVNLWLQLLQFRFKLAYVTIYTPVVYVTKYTPVSFYHVPKYNYSYTQL